MGQGRQWQLKWFLWVLIQLSIAGTGRQEKPGADCAGHPVRRPDLRIIGLGEFPRFRQVAGIGNICIPTGRNTDWYYASESELRFWLSTSMTTCGHDRVPAGVSMPDYPSHVKFPVKNR